MACRFYLGTHKPHWLSRVDAPALFVSRRRLAEYKTPPVAATAWALDSGGFSELQLHGRWTVTPEQYTAEVRRWRDETGLMDWAACMDWMCEPVVIAGGKAGRVTFAGTKKSVGEHQRLTVANYLRLNELAPEVPWLPVIQGWEHGEYLRCVELYGREGVDLRQFPAVGLGSVCRRQHTQVAEDVIRDLSAFGIRVHAFGFKTEGLLRSHRLLASADSMAWSYDARMSEPLPGCKHGSCANCHRWAFRWHDRLTRRLTNELRQPKAHPLYA